MTAWLPYLYWPLAVMVLARAQGLVLPAIRRTPPGAEAEQQDVALHYLLTIFYFGALVFVPSTWLIALLSRLLLFDPVLNKSAGVAAFAVGQTALTDRAIRWAADKLSMEPEHLRCILWVVCLVIAATGYWILIK
jgi:hypothetical protein